jgi:hypothetical protein
MGIKISIEQLNILIEAAVHELNEQKLLSYALSRDD